MLSLVLAAPLLVHGADKFTITVANDSGLARPAETIAVTWSDVNARLPHAMIQHIAVRDAGGHALPFQVTNVNPEAKDPHNVGVAYGELLFQHDFAAGENTATFTVERTDDVAPPFPTKVFARFVPERLDDFAWENDRIAHRTYGPALAAPDTEHRGKEVLVTSGLDVWCKRVPYPIVDRWYNKGHDHYHHDEGEGMDMYNVGTSRGCGGTGIWDGHSLAVAGNYRTWKVIANGPVRAIFELTYGPWETHGVQVAETKRFIVDAGHNLDCIESTFTFENARSLTVAIGLNKDSADKGQTAGKATVTRDETTHALIQWEPQKTNGALGEAIIVPSGFTGFAEDNVNQLALATVQSGKPLRYYVGAGWTKSGQFASEQDWRAYVAAEAARVNSPIRVTLSTP
jgi:pectinesterase